MNRETCKELRDAIIAALGTVARMYDVEFRAGSCSFTPSSATIRIEASVRNPQTGVVETKERELFRRRSRLYSLKSTALDKTFTYSGKKLTIVGLKPRKCRCPIIITDAAGRRYKMSVELVCNCLRLTAPGEVL